MKSAHTLASEHKYIFERDDEDGEPLSTVSLNDLEVFAKLVQIDVLNHQIDKLHKAIGHHAKKADRFDSDDPMASIHVAFSDLLRIVQLSILKDMPDDPLKS